MKSVKSIADKCSNKINRLAESEEDLLSNGRLSGIIEEALQEIRNAAIRECAEVARAIDGRVRNTDNPHNACFIIEESILALLDK